MLRVFGWVVRFFDSLRAFDDQLEATWLNKSWLEFITWWFGGSLAIAVFALLLIAIPGTVLLELNRLYHSLRGANPPAAGLRSEEHTSELQSRLHLVCRLLL